jgi:hypothetical protein
MLVDSSRLDAQQGPRPLRDHKRVPGFDEMQIAFDFEPVCFANMKLADDDYMAHGDGFRIHLAPEPAGVRMG